jgi:hypothetical protein
MITRQKLEEGTRPKDKETWGMDGEGEAAVANSLSIRGGEIPG